MPLSSLLQAFKSKSTPSGESRTRVAVIGAGRMGQFHLKHLSRNPMAELVGVADVEANRAASLAKKFRTQAFANPGDIRILDAAVIATPTPTHYAIARSFLER